MGIKVQTKAEAAKSDTKQSGGAHALSPPDLRIFLVRCNAQFMGPTEIAKRVKEELGVDITPQVAALYNPTKVAGARLSKKFKELFAAERRAFIENLEDLPMAHRANRLRLLNDLALNAKRESDRLSAIDLSRKEMAELDYCEGD